MAKRAVRIRTALPSFIVVLTNVITPGVFSSGSKKLGELCPLSSSNLFTGRQLGLQLSCGHSPYVTFTLTRGCVCRLEMLLVLASAVILSTQSLGTHDHILVSQIRESPNLEGQVPVFISPRQWVPFSSPPTTRRATVEVLDPVSTRAKTEFLLNLPSL
jgi:hypothetical protein